MPVPLLLYSDTFLQHQTAGHPESPERLKHILSLLDSQHLLSRFDLLEPQSISLELLHKIHSPDPIASLESFCRKAGQGTRIDEDTVVSTGSFQAALVAAGAAVHMIDAVLGNSHVVFSLVRPPGHHALPEKTMGFCLFNNVALAARHALDAYQLKRILILDWDAHHGNGTEHIFYQDPHVLFVSLHQYPNWPGTGALEDIGEGAGCGYNVNVPLPLKYGDTAYQHVFRKVVEPIANRFRPQLILVSAGYDAHHRDPLTDMGVTAHGFSLMTEAVMKLAERLCEGRIGFLLEGGYHLDALAYSVLGTLLTIVQEQVVVVKEPNGCAPWVMETELDVLVRRLKAIHPLLSEELGP